MKRQLNAASVRPREPLLLGLGVAVFASIVAAVGTRDWLIAVIVFGVAFIVCIVLFATFLLLIPNDDSPEPRQEIFIPVLMRDDADATNPRSEPGQGVAAEDPGRTAEDPGPGGTEERAPEPPSGQTRPQRGEGRRPDDGTGRTGSGARTTGA